MHVLVCNIAVKGTKQVRKPRVCLAGNLTMLLDSKGEVNPTFCMLTLDLGCMPLLQQDVTSSCDRRHRDPQRIVMRFIECKEENSLMVASLTPCAGIGMDAARVKDPKSLVKKRCRD